MSNIILVSGFKRAGKDTISSMIAIALAKFGKSSKIRSFAEPMKFIGATALNINLEQLDTFKNNPDRYKLQIIDTHSSGLVHVTNCRSYLQQLGTEATKPVFGEEVWADLLYSRASRAFVDYVIVPDFRFIAEYRKPAIVIRVESNMASTGDLHSSETELLGFPFDYTLNNDDYQITQTHIDNFVEGLLRNNHES